MRRCDCRLAVAFVMLAASVSSAQRGRSARSLIRAGVPERIAMLLTGHKTRAVFDRYNIINDQELLTAGQRLAAYLRQDS